MKLLHTSDWHLGRMIMGRSLLEDQQDFISRVFLPLVAKEQPACVIIAGDVYDRQIASAAAIRLFDETISDLCKLNVPVAFISGNHDSSDRMAIGTSFLRNSGIYIGTRLEDALNPFIISKDGESAQIFLLPWCDPSTAREFFKTEDIHTYAQSYSAILNQMKPLFAPNMPHILVSHSFVAGSTLSDSENPIFVGGSGEIPAELFSDYDYVALGHLHAPQKSGKNGRYSGSPLTYSVSEEHQKKSVTLLDISTKNLVSSQIPVVPLHRVKSLKGTFSEILQRGKNSVDFDYTEIYLTDAAPIYQSAERLRPYYPNLLSVHCEWFMQQNQEEQSINKKFHQNELSHEDLFNEFFSQICEYKTDTDDKEIFLSILSKLTTEEEAANQ